MMKRANESVRTPSQVLFYSFSVLMACLLGVLFLAACAGPRDEAVRVEGGELAAVIETPDSTGATPGAVDDGVPTEPASQARNEATAVAEAERKDSDEAASPMDGAEEMIVVGSGAASQLLVPTATSAIAFDSAGLVASQPAPHKKGASIGRSRRDWVEPTLTSMPLPMPTPPHVDWNTEDYDDMAEGGFLKPLDSPLSTFSIDVDTASYANVRRFLRDQTKPPPGAVRIEELVNYFRYAPRVEAVEGPFAVDMEIFESPWRAEHRLVRIAVEGQELAKKEIPPRNLVFLLDVSGSMHGPDRLGLVKYGLSRLTESLRPSDRVSIVVYAGASGLVLPPTPGNDEETIVRALERLEAGGSTAGASGIRLAYETARKHFDPDGINRVILATDGDFNVGVSNRSELIELIEAQRESGVFLTVLGVGRGNLNDATMEQIADHGNGNYAYIDGRAEARKVLVEQADATLVTIAKDVKIQVEFNPKRVQAYRLIGYENRRLADQDFNDDTKDAGEIGAGHHVTALYEIVPVGSKGGVGGGTVDPLKYQQVPELSEAAGTGEWLTVKLRYKEPTEGESRLVSTTLAGQPATFGAASENARFSTAVALFGMMLRDSEYRGAGSYRLVEKLAREALGEDVHGERQEFVELVQLASRL